MSCSHMNLSDIRVFRAFHSVQGELAQLPEGVPEGPPGQRPVTLTECPFTTSVWYRNPDDTRYSCIMIRGVS